MNDNHVAENIAELGKIRTAKWLYWVRGLLIIAMCGAGYLAWVSLHHGAVAGCGIESGCNAVLGSRWAYWMGIPVSVPAVLVYVALFASTILLQKNSSPDDQRGSWLAIIILSVTMAGAAFWFVSLQVFVIQSFCKYCLTAHVCGFTAALICLMNIPYATDPDTPMWTTGSGKRGIPRHVMPALVLTGLTCVAVLVGGQVLVEKQRNVVKVLKNSSTAGANQLALQLPGASPEVLPPSPNAKLIASHTVALYTNEFIINFDEVPMLGSLDASNVIVCLFDYTCPHCQALHPILDQVGHDFSNQLAIVCLPVTLSPDCNPFIPRASARASPISCDLARLGLAVFRVNPQLHQEFDDWIFSTPRPPMPQKARAYAEQLVGADKLKAALNDPWTEKQLVTDCKLQRANWLAVDSSALPQIVMGDAVSSGPINSLEHLELLLNRYMGVNLTAK